MVESDLPVDVAIVGAGPAGLGAALELIRRKLSVLVFDRGAVAESIFRFPRGMLFYTTRERTEIGDVPFAIVEAKPTREQALAYYRGIALREKLPLRPYEEVIGLGGEDGSFRLHSRTRAGAERTTRCRKVVVATGAFAEPNLLGIPGEDLPKVSHFYQEGHAFAGCSVAVIGGGNSAADAALDLYRSGARVTLLHRGPELSPGLKYWVAPDLRNRIDEGSIQAFFESRVVRIHADRVEVETPAGRRELPNDFVLAMTGYGPEVGLFDRLSLPSEPDTLVPLHDPDTFETPRKGVHVIGAVVAGRISGKVFIENGRLHGRQIADRIRQQLQEPSA